MKRKLAALLAINLLAVSLLACTPSEETDSTTTSSTATQTTAQDTESVVTEETTTEQTTEITTEETTTEETTAEVTTEATSSVETEDETTVDTDSGTAGDEFTIIGSSLDETNTQAPISWRSSSEWYDLETDIGTTPTTYHYPFEATETGFIMIQTANVPGLEADEASDAEIYETYLNSIAAEPGITMSDDSVVTGAPGSEILTIHYTQAIEGADYDGYGIVTIEGDYIISMIGFLKDGMQPHFSDLVDNIYSSVEVVGTDGNTSTSPSLPNYQLDTEVTLGLASWLMDSTWPVVENNDYVKPLVYLYPFGNDLDGLLMISEADQTTLDTTSTDTLTAFYEFSLVDPSLQNVQQVDAGFGSDVISFTYTQEASGRIYSALCHTIMVDDELYFLTGLIYGEELTDEWIELVNEVFGTITASAEASTA